MQRAIGKLTTALANILKSLSYDLTIIVRYRKAAGRKDETALDAKHIEEWCAAEIWKDMVQKATQGLRHIHEHEHKDSPGFFSKMVHRLSTMSLKTFSNNFGGFGN